MRARGTDDWQDNCSLFFDDSEAAIGLTEDFFFPFMAVGCQIEGVLIILDSGCPSTLLPPPFEKTCLVLLC